MPVAQAPSAPRFEYQPERPVTLGIGTGAPRLSWSVLAADRGWTQSAYEVEIQRGDATNRFVVASAEQVFVPWPDAPLTSRESAHVRIRVADGELWSGWSGTAVVEAGLLTEGDWDARFVSPTRIGGIGTPAPTIMRRVELPDGILSARLYVTALGAYDGTINGRPVSDTVLAPGWTSYEHRLRYQTYDVASLLVPGTNTLAFTLGNGWFRGRLGFEGRSAVYGDRLALLAQLEVVRADGATLRLSTDDSWAAVESAIVTDDLYDGETRDLRRTPAAGGESAVETIDYPLERLTAPDGPPVRPTATLAPMRIFASPSGKTLVDFGQNLVGRVRLTVRGAAAGDEVIVRHAEVLEHGELGTRPLRAAAATDRYLLAGAEEVVLEPTFTLHGFRYAEVTGVGELAATDLAAVVIGSDLERRGWFDSSDDLLNRLHENIVWSMRGNFVDLPTDCPQRDERLGWTGDTQVFVPTAAFLHDSTGFLSSWLTDLAAEQWPDGSVPYVVPDVLGRESSPSPTAAWGDAATVVPWTLYERTGDIGVLRRQFGSMKAWADRIIAAAGEDRIWSGGFQFGDWLDPTAPPDEPGKAKADPDLVATAYLARSTQIVADTARVLGLAEEELAYSVIAAEVRDAFAARFVTADGRLQSDAPTAYAVALVFGLLARPDQRAHAGARLADLVRASGFRISTGFVGTPLICDALTMTGHAHVAHRLLLQTGCPSWLYPVTMGATSIWERWDSMLPDGTINPGEMTSFNHFALGGVGDWMHRSVAGLAPAAPGYRRLRIEPVPPAELRFAEARHLTPYGLAGVRWERADERLSVTVEVPVGVSAEVVLPSWTEPVTVGHGVHRWEVDDLPDGDTVPRTIRDLVDDRRAWAALLDATRAHSVGPQTEPGLAAWLAPFYDAPVSQLAHALAPEGITTARMRRTAAEAADQALSLTRSSAAAVTETTPPRTIGIA